MANVIGNYSTFEVEFMATTFSADKKCLCGATYLKETKQQWKGKRNKRPTENLSHCQRTHSLTHVQQISLRLTPFAKIWLPHRPQTGHIVPTFWCRPYLTHTLYLSCRTTLVLSIPNTESFQGIWHPLST
jgi:hypothetical protein